MLSPGTRITINYCTNCLQILYVCTVGYIVNILQSTHYSLIYSYEADT